jgi:formate hydrogenlyase subunit 3/multisubunit Na+/H+ antiporter MnhD subunit
MVTPIFIVAIALGVGFAIGVLNKLGRNFTGGLVLAAIAAMTFISYQWFAAFQFGNQGAEYVYTAGFKPPFSIQLLMGHYEAIITLMINAIGLIGGVYMFNSLKERGSNAQVVYLILLMGLNVIVMTRDLFNLFVFLEISSISIAGLILLEKGTRSMGAGFKYILATSIISGFLLIGIIFSYYYTGSLFIDDISANLLAVKGGAMAAFMIMIAIVLELKPFPANGWGLDVYEGSDPGLAAIISAASATASYFVLYKIMSIAGPEWNYYISLIGAITFVGSNLLGLKQINTRRMLGYSSIGQIGLLMLILGFKDILGESTPFIAFGILISHYFAKAGLFWLSGIVKAKGLKDWAVIRKKPFFLFLMGTFIFALIGFPPFPSFFAKWTLVMDLVNTGNIVWVVAILFGSMMEAVYLFRWFGYAIKAENEHLEDFSIKIHKIIPVWIVAIALYVAGYFAGQSATMGGTAINFIPLFFVAVLFAIDFLPVFIKNTIAIAAMAFYFYTVYPQLDNLRLIFEVIFMVGGILTLIAGYAYRGKRSGFYPVALLMYAGLTAIIEASTTLQFFYGWELMTAGSYFLIIRGKRSMPHGLSYMLFSVGGAYALLAAFGMAHVGQEGYSLAIINNISYLPQWAYGLFIVGFLTKTASVGLHIWLPGAHGEAESDVSPMVSAILLKAGVFGLVLTLIGMGGEANQYTNLAYVLGWLGAITALAGNLMAVFQEDAKRLLAYSSIGQLGYIVLGLAMMTHLGWLAGFSYVVNHFLYKAILFLTIGAVVLRVGTHNMYEMGGLIKRMPMAFIAVLIGIIALSGVPPLSGFAGKWLFYNAIMDKGWYLQGAMMLFSGGIAFLYLWRLIHTIFLGQLKDNHRKVKDISIWFAIPIYILIIGIMVYSAKPQWILQPLGNVIAGFLPTGQLTWDGGTAFSTYGYWSGTLVMITIGAMFMLVLAWLLMSTRKAHKVKQFDITYSGERPERPETTHVAYNSFEGLYKAMWPATIPLVAAFWDNVTNALHDLAGFTRRIYSGNGQVYMLHILFFIIVTYLVIIGG